MANKAGAPPADLAAAIRSASNKYGILPSTLWGIWRIESGSSYPNKFVNSSGYGGLFGTTNWKGSAQSQAELSASILSNLLHTYKGNMSQALLAYSGGGYSSVSGGPGPANYTPPNPASSSGAPVYTPTPAAAPVDTSSSPAAPAPPAIGTPPGALDPGVEMPGSAQHYLPGQSGVADSWQSIAAMPNLSPDTQRLIALSSGG